MDINRSSYYKWLNHREEKNIYELNREMLTEMLIEKHEKYPSNGYHRLACKIRKETGWIFSDNLAHKCCKFAGIKSKSRTRRFKPTGKEHIFYPNSIRGNWSVDRPLEVIVSDMTHLKYRGKTFEWTFMVDVYDNSIISSHVSSVEGDRKPYFDCLFDLKRLTAKKKTPTVLHTDQGAVYASLSYNNDLTKYNITRSMSRSGTPTDNPVIESLNGWFKSEILLDFDIDAYSSIESFLEYFVEYCNKEREFYSLGYLSPYEYRRSKGY